MVIHRIITKRLLSPREAASYLGISERQLEYLEHQEIVHQTRLPNTRKRLFDILDLDGLIEKCKNKKTLITEPDIIYLTNGDKKKT